MNKCPVGWLGAVVAITLGVSNLLMMQALERERQSNSKTSQTAVATVVKPESEIPNPDGSFFRITRAAGLVILEQVYPKGSKVLRAGGREEVVTSEYVAVREVQHGTSMEPLVTWYLDQKGRIMLERNYQDEEPRVISRRHRKPSDEK